MSKNTYYYTYGVMGTPDKKTKRVPKYKVRLRVNVDTDERVLIGCTCKSREFHPYTPCKHMKIINNRLGHKLQ